MQGFPNGDIGKQANLMGSLAPPPLLSMQFFWGWTWKNVTGGLDSKAKVFGELKNISKGNWLF